MWIIRLEYLLGWQRLPLFGRYWYVEMTRFQRLKFFSYAGYVPVHNFAPFMVVSSACEEPQPVYEVSTWLEDTARDIFIQHG
jgi:hypothetical protein